MKRPDKDTTFSELIIRYVDSYLESTNTKRDTFVKESLLPLLIEYGFLKEPENAYEFTRWQARHCKSVQRQLKQEISINVDWFPIFLLALPDDYKQAAKAEVCGFLGSYFVPMTLNSKVTPEPTEAGLSLLSKEFGDVLHKATPAMDGVYDDQDNPLAVQQYANELQEVAAAAIAELGRIYQGTGIEPAAYKAMRLSPFFK
ncbi:MAG: hypothetical protein ACK5NC_11850 [Vibrio sp.]